MSTVLLLKDRGKDKAGAAISVPFAVGKELTASGIAHYPVQPAIERPAIPQDEKPGLQDQFAAQLREIERDHADEVALHMGEIKRLNTELESAKKQNEDLKTKLAEATKKK